MWTAAANKCVLNVSNAHYKYYWECKDRELLEKPISKWVEKPDDLNPYAYKINKRLKEKADKIVVKFARILDSREDWSNEKKIEKIDMIIERLNNIERIRPQYSNLINYLIVSFEGVKESTK